MKFTKAAFLLTLVAVLAAAWLLLPLPPGYELMAQSREALTKSDIDRWMEELSNWGRWASRTSWGL